MHVWLKIPMPEISFSILTIPCIKERDNFVLFKVHVCTYVWHFKGIVHIKCKILSLFTILVCIPYCCSNPFDPYFYSVKKIKKLFWGLEL